jgi:hypothetical protein
MNYELKKNIIAKEARPKQMKTTNNAVIANCKARSRKQAPTIERLSQRSQ